MIPDLMTYLYVAIAMTLVALWADGRSSDGWF